MADKISTERIFTQDDFRKINAYRLKQRLTKSAKRKRNDDIVLDEEFEERSAR